MLIKVEISMGQEQNKKRQKNKTNSQRFDNFITTVCRKIQVTYRFFWTSNSKFTLFFISINVNI